MPENPYLQQLMAEIENFNTRFSQYRLIRIKAKQQETKDGVPDNLRKLLEPFCDELKISAYQISDRIKAIAPSYKLTTDGNVKKIKDTLPKIVEPLFPDIIDLEEFSEAINQVYALKLIGSTPTMEKIKDLTK